MQYDIIIIGAGPGVIYSAYELTKEQRNLSAGSSPSPPFPTG